MSDSEAPGRASYHFSGARVLVTGGTGGIGLAIARRFSGAGAEVTITGTREAASAYPDEDLSAFQYRQLDLTRHDSVQDLAGQVGELDVLVNNAGGTGGTDSPFDFDTAVTVNLNATYHLTEALVPTLQRSSSPFGTSVINLASEMSLFASPYFPGYGAAKAGIVQLTRTFAAQYAEAGVRCNAILPGSVRTRMTRLFADDADIHEAVCRRTPLRRWARAGEMAGAALFLASADASFITGHTLVVDGGYSIIDA